MRISVTLIGYNHVVHDIFIFNFKDEKINAS